MEDESKTIHDGIRFDLRKNDELKQIKDCVGIELNLKIHCSTLGGQTTIPDMHPEDATVIACRMTTDEIKSAAKDGIVHPRRRLEAGEHQITWDLHHSHTALARYNRFDPRNWGFWVLDLFY